MLLFDKQTYIERRRLLKERIGSGIILLMGNNDAPANYPNNVYRFRQDSSFLYFVGISPSAIIWICKSRVIFTRAEHGLYAGKRSMFGDTGSRAILVSITVTM